MLVFLVSREGRAPSAAADSFARPAAELGEMPTRAAGAVAVAAASSGAQGCAEASPASSVDSPAESSSERPAKSFTPTPGRAPPPRIICRHGQAATRNASVRHKTRERHREMRWRYAYRRRHALLLLSQRHGLHHRQGARLERIEELQLLDRQLSMEAGSTVHGNCGRFALRSHV